jgi:hypothetical protein
MIDLRPLIELDFWFALQPNGLSPTFEKGFFALFGLMIIIGAVMRIVARQKKHGRYHIMTFKHVAAMLITMGFVGLVWFFFTFELIYLLGSRFWFLVWIIGLVAWCGHIIKFVKVRIPEMRAAGERKAQENKYLPRKNKR